MAAVEGIADGGVGRRRREGGRQSRRSQRARASTPPLSRRQAESSAPGVYGEEGEEATPSRSRMDLFLLDRERERGGRERERESFGGRFIRAERSETR